LPLINFNYNRTELQETTTTLPLSRRRTASEQDTLQTRMFCSRDLDLDPMTSIFALDLHREKPIFALRLHIRMLQCPVLRIHTDPVTVYLL